jgi:hypothetical protein
MTYPFSSRVLTAAAVLVALVASAGLFWVGIPLMVLWLLARITESSAEHFVLGLLAVPAAMLAFAPVMLRLNTIYIRLTNQRSGGPLTYILVWSFLIAVVAIFILFAIAETPQRQVI